MKRFVVAFLFITLFSIFSGVSGFTNKSSNVIRTDEKGIYILKFNSEQYPIPEVTLPKGVRYRMDKYGITIESDPNTEITLIIKYN